MTLEQLRIFIAVAEREHVTQASRDLNLTQSATSAAISALETRHATQLFDRIGRRVVLTEAGRLFLVEARGVLARAVSAETVLDDLAGLKRGTLALAASQTIANYWLPPLIHRFQSQYPGVGVTMAMGNSATVAASVHDGLADVGLIEARIDDPALANTVIGEDSLVLVTGRDNALATCRNVTRTELSAARWVMREKGSGTRAIFEQTIAAFGLSIADIDVAMELPSNEAVRSAVEAGAGAAVLSQLVITGSLQAGALIKVNAALPGRQFFSLRHKERYVSCAQQAFFNMLKPKAVVEKGKQRQRVTA